ncbi:hypothetical protein Tco_0309026 [Tanacetum coccineum]
MSQPANDEFSQHLSDDEASNHEDASDTGAAPKQQQQVIPQTTAISNIKLPILKKEEYDIWAMEMEHYLEYIDNEVWKAQHQGLSRFEIQLVKSVVIQASLLESPVPSAHLQVAYPLTYGMMPLKGLNSADVRLLSARFYVLAIVVSFALTLGPLEVLSVRESYNLHDSN